MFENPNGCVGVKWGNAMEHTLVNSKPGQEESLEDIAAGYGWVWYANI